MTSTSKSLSSCLIAAFLASCGGGGGGESNVPPVSSPPPPTISQSPAGVWNGVNPQDNSRVIAMIAPDGEFIIRFAEGVMMYGILATQGSQVSVNQFYAIPSDIGFQITMPRLVGSFSQETTLTLNIPQIPPPYTYFGGGSYKGPWTIAFTYQSFHRQVSSLNTVSGTYVDNRVRPTVSWNISSDGTLFAQQTQNNGACVLNGRVRTLDINRNLYRITADTGGQSCGFYLIGGAYPRDYSGLGFLANDSDGNLRLWMYLHYSRATPMNTGFYQAPIRQ